MDTLIPNIAPNLLLAAMAVALLAGLVKGIVGFAMPMVMISGLSSLLPPEVALAALILPTLVTNGVQALRQGWAEARASIRRFRVFLLAGLVTLVASAQLVAIVPSGTLLLMIGVPVVGFAALQIVGWRPRIAPGARVEAGIGGFAGAIGGVSGIWGPPTVMYLTAIDTPKTDQMRVQGVVYGLGAAALAGAHVQSGIFNAQTWPVSALMVPPALAGLWLGFRLSDRVDQRTFRRATLIVLAVAGLNLIRRGLAG